MMGKGVSGIIVAGGKSSRFGSPKAFAEKDGIPFYQYTIAAMEPLVESIVLVSSSELITKFTSEDTSCKIITDNPAIAGLGPLAGIYSGMEHLTSEWYLISPIDTPFINTRTYEILLDHIGAGKEAIVPIVNGRLEPLISIFHCSIKEKMKEQLRCNMLAPRQLFQNSQVAYVEFDDDNPFRNINYQEDLERYIKTKEGGS